MALVLKVASGASPLLNDNTSAVFSGGHWRLNFRKARPSTVVLVAAVSLAFSVAGCSGGRSATVVDGRTIHIENFGRIDAKYYRGAQPEGHDYADLAAIGVKTIINLTSDDAQPNEKALTEQAGLSYAHIPMTMHRPPTPAQLAELFRIVDDPAKQPVYVHCAGGQHRTGVMTAIYRMVEQQWTADQAFKEMKQYHFGADFLHPEFKEFVFGYHPDKSATAVRPAATNSF